MIIQFPPASLRAWLRGIYGDAPLSLEQFSYQFVLPDIANGAQASASIQILANADFVLTDIQPLMSAGAALNFSDMGSGAQYFNRPLLIAGNPPVIVYPRFIAGNSGVLCTVNNNTGGVVSLHNVVMHGFHVRGLN